MDKFLYFLECLEENTDEEHGVEMEQIRKALRVRMDLPTLPDRKSIYDDVRCLNQFRGPRYEEAVKKERGKTETRYKLISDNGLLLFLRWDIIDMDEKVCRGDCR